MSLLDEIRAKLDIVEVVGAAVPLQRAGRHFKARCPFHTERTPSFYVFPESQSWHCFGACASGGDLFTFVMKREGVSFPEALGLLAERAGMPLAPPAAAQREEDSELSRLRELLLAAAQYFHHLLLNTPQGRPARDYLERRGVAKDSQEAFLLGYNPEAGEGLANYLRERGFSSPEMVAGGILGQREQGETYPLFRHRLMFPIRDGAGRVVGFGGRVLDDRAAPKYLNSPQTRLFDKSSLLYGLDQAKETIRRHNRGIIVEGYLDVIIAHQCGIKNVVASLGTALTEKQVQLLKRYSKNLVLALDPDAAGKEATLRGLEVAEHAADRRFDAFVDWRGVVRYQKVLDAEIRILTLPQGKDPDEVILQDPQAWQGLVEGATPVLDFLLETVTSRLDLTTPVGKSEAVQKLAPLFAEIPDAVQRAHYLQKLSRMVEVDEKVLERALGPRRAGGRSSAQGARPGEGEALPAELRRRDPLEEYCLASLFQWEELRAEAQGLSAEHFQRPEARALFLVWQQYPEPLALEGTLGTELGAEAERLRTLPLPPASQGQRLQAFRDCVRRLEERGLRHWKKRQALLEEELERAGQGVALAVTSLALAKGSPVESEPQEESLALEVAQLQQEGLKVARRLRLLTQEGRRAQSHTPGAG